MDALKTYDYLSQARERVFESLRSLTSEQYQRKFGFGLGTIASALTHIMISEWYYVERLTGKPVPPYEKWPIKYETPPSYAEIETHWYRQTKFVRASIAAEGDWNRTIRYDSFPDDAGKRYHITATAGDIVTQLVLHEVHHRAQIMAMLRETGDGVKPLQDLDYNDLIYERQEIV